MLVVEDEALIRLDLTEMLDRGGLRRRRRGRRRRAGGRAGPLAAPGSGDHGREDAEGRRDRRGGAIVEERIAPVVMLTAFSQRDLIERARDAGAMAYLVKPFARPSWCRRSSWRSPGSPRAGARGRGRHLTERLETRKLVDRAKGLLMTGRDVRTGRVPVDPAHRDGPPHDDAGGRRGRRRRARHAKKVVGPLHVTLGSPSGCGPIKTGRRCCRRVEGCPNVPSALTTVEAARALGWATRRGLGKDLSSMTRRRTIVTAAILAGSPRAHGVRHQPERGRRHRRRQHLRHQQGHARHRHGRTALGQPVGPGSRHAQLGEAGRRPGQPEVHRARATSWPSSRRTTRPRPRRGPGGAPSSRRPNVVGVVGTLNSRVARPSAPILAGKTSCRSRPPTPTRPDRVTTWRQRRSGRTPRTSASAPPTSSRARSRPSTWCRRRATRTSP